MTEKKKDPPNVFDPPGFKQVMEAHAQAAEDARARAETSFETSRVIGRYGVGGEQTVMYALGPLPLPQGGEEFVFQVIWFGGADDEWPHAGKPAPGPIASTHVRAGDVELVEQEEAPIVGKMALWAFHDPKNATNLLALLWGIDTEPEIPEGAVN